MAQTKLTHVVERVARTGRVEAADVLEVRRLVYGDDGAISRDEAEAIFAIDAVRTKHRHDWSVLFIEAMTDHVLNQQPPTGYLTADKAAWLERQIARRKLPATDTDVALVARLIDQAREVPPAFSAFALRLVKDTVVHLDGPDADGQEHGGGRITAADVALLNRVLWGAGCEGHLAISREEAEALFAIADGTTGADNDPAFDDLFARAVGNYLIGATGRHVPSREAALRWETEPEYKVDVLAALSRVLASAPAAMDGAFIADALRSNRTLAGDLEHTIGNDNDTREAAMAADAVLTPEKAGWLAERVNRNGVFTAAERALVRFVAREAAALDASLKSLVSEDA